MGKTYNNTNGKTVSTPRRPWDSERFDRELQLIGRYGLRNKREVWRAQLLLAVVRKKARALMILDEKDPKRIFDGGALLRRLARMGVIESENQKLENLLNLTVERFLDRRLQTRVLALGYAKSIHHARALINQRHIRVGKTLVNQPNFTVRTASDRQIGFVQAKTKKVADEDY